MGRNRIQAVLLGAGYGTRLGRLTAAGPKLLVPLGGGTLLEHQVEYLREQGVSEVIVNAHHRAEDVTRFVETHTWRVPVRVAVEDNLLGTAGALTPLVSTLEETFVVLYGDVVTTLPLAAPLGLHRVRRAMATICCHRPASWTGKGALTLDVEGRVTSFAEKPVAVPDGALANSGVYVLSREILSAIGSVPADFGADVFPALVRGGAPVWAFPHDETVIDVGTPEGLELARERVGLSSG